MMYFARLVVTGFLCVTGLCLAGCIPAEMLTESSENKEAGDSNEDAKSVPAGVGVGKKGHSYGKTPATAPAAAYWRVEEKVAFEIQIPQYMALYKAEKGHAPKTHDDFMKEIVEKYKVKLPELPDDRVYRYDPETETLMVDPVASQ